jgi:ATP-binding cassette, subfamily B, bacterial
MKLLWQEVKKHKKTLALALVLATINQVFSLLDPQIFRLLIDNYASQAGDLTRDQFIQGAGLLLLASVGVAFVSRVAKAFQDYYLNVITQRSGTNLYASSVSHAFSLPYAVFEDERSGELLSKLQKAREDSQRLILNSVNVVFLSLVGLVFVLVYATTVHPFIGLGYFLILPTLGTATFILSRKIKRAQQMIVRETASLSGSTTETLRNVELVKSLGLEEQEVKRLNQVNEKILGLELQKVKMVRRLDFIQGTLTNALRSALLLLTLWLIFTGDITLGQFFSLLFYSFFLFQPLAQLGMVANNYQEAKASLEQLNKVFEQKPAPKPVDPKPLNTIEKISYQGVHMAYREGEREALSGINLEINSGETVAFVGPSGSGKSTMVKLLAGLYSPTQGKLLFNSIDVGGLDVDELRKKIGLVAQETQLFAGTIRENLLFVKPSATDGDCIEALQLAQAKTIIDRTGDGLNTKIGEGGIRLSGGERQRLAIARALLREPDLIVFDEATSSLDSITEKAITETIKGIGEIHKKQIKVLVAHRLSTIAHADRIYVFEQGKIIETGTHSELVSKQGLYSALWREQIAAEK